MLRVPAIPPNSNPRKGSLPNGGLPTGGRMDLGFDQLGWVRVIRHTTGMRYEVVGTVRRRPRICAVSAATATALMGMGLPTVAARCTNGSHCTDCTDCTGATKGTAATKGTDFTKGKV